MGTSGDEDFPHDLARAFAQAVLLALHLSGLWALGLTNAATLVGIGVPVPLLLDRAVYGSIACNKREFLPACLLKTL